MTDNEQAPAAQDATAGTTAVFRSQPGSPEPSEQSGPAQQQESTVGVVVFGSGTLLTTRGPGNLTRYLLNRTTITAGRNPDSDIFLDDVTVSRAHAEIRWLDNEYRISDVGSLNGTYVNGVQAESQPLSDGDEIRIGVFRLSFACRRTP
ncbi:FHA domain-containing protein [Mycolicibacterium sp. HS_4_1]